jgi:hypothetical protein
MHRKLWGRPGAASPPGTICESDLSIGLWNLQRCFSQPRNAQGQTRRRVFHLATLTIASPTRAWTHRCVGNCKSQTTVTVSRCLTGCNEDNCGNMSFWVRPSLQPRTTRLTAAAFLMVLCRSTDTWTRWQRSSTCQMHLRKLLALCTLPPDRCGMPPKTCGGQLVVQADVTCVTSSCSAGSVGYIACYDLQHCLLRCTR